MMMVCPICGYRDEAERLVEPSESYVDNLKRIAEYFYGEYSFEFYKLPYFKFRDVMHERFERDYPKPDKDDKPAMKRWRTRRAKYFEYPEARVAYGVNFCSRDGSAYAELKSRLEDAVAENGIDENGEPFSTEREFHLIQDRLKSDGCLKDEREDMFMGFKKGASAVNRILLMRVSGAENLLSISDCSVSPFFPELSESETEEIAGLYQ